MTSQKLVAGAQLKKLRRNLGLTQKRMAEELSISTSYLTLIEKNQRPITAQLLIKLVAAYDLDLSVFVASDTRLIGEIHEAFHHPLIREAVAMPGDREIEDVVASSPDMARALVTLCDHVRQIARQKEQLELLVSNTLEMDIAELAGDPVEEIRHYVQQSDNYFPAIEDHTEALAARLEKDGGLGLSTLVHYLETRHHLQTQIVPVDVMSEMLRYYDKHSRRIQLSELLSEAGKRFHLAYQIGQLEMAAEIEALVRAAGFSGQPTRDLAKVMFCNYFAASLLMPYTEFLTQAENMRYDLEILCKRFSVSFEQVAHRVTTLQRPGTTGIPFFFIRMDIAGNVTKRFAPGGGPFARSGGACPKWHVHQCFAEHGKLSVQKIELPDTKQYFSVARTVSRAGGSFGRPAQRLAIGLGCPAHYAGRLIYSDQFKEGAKAHEIGVNCHVCPRNNCRERAFTPIDRQLSLNDRVRGISPFQFTR